MRTSKFCLHPAGDTPSSCRLFDAIVSHCVPVVVSDKIELPYEDEIDYSRYSLFFSDKEAVHPGFLVEKLQKLPKEKWLEMLVLLIIVRVITWRVYVVGRCRYVGLSGCDSWKL
ncbi:unnamed protein product [Linum trigynum]|uniref:Exostosin GT47 domain-containing protein n=1 Tax=Linum trigynum TaxID=586398 RepID=A0AAV2FW61_9ROSI